MLAEVSPAMHQRDRNHRRSRICGRPQSIARQHAQTSGVGRKRRRKRDFHGKVRNPASGQVQAINVGDGGGEAGRLIWKSVLMESCIGAISTLPDIEYNDGFQSPSAQRATDGDQV